jgi:acetyl esterase/lipase
VEDSPAELPTEGPSPQSRALLSVLRLGLRPIVQRAHSVGVPVSVVRATVDGGSRLLPPDRRVRVEPVRAAPRDVDAAGEDPPPVAGEWVRGTVPGYSTDSTDVTDSTTDGAVLYLHGGAYVFCSPRTHRVLTSRLARDSGLPVFVPKYRLAPEHPFPAALDDALAAYRWLLARGIPAARIVVAGDSAGGHLAATLAAELCRAGLPVPAGIVLFSPWADLSCELSTEWDRECRDPYVLPALGIRFARLYAGECDFGDPRLALLRCTAKGLPPFLIQAGGADALRPDAERLAEVLTALGVHCDLQIWRGQMHVFQALHSLLPEGQAALREAARFIGTVTGAEPASEAA